MRLNDATGYERVFNHVDEMPVKTSITKGKSWGDVNCHPRRHVLYKQRWFRLSITWFSSGFCAQVCQTEMA